MLWNQAAAVGIGAASGAWLRWGLGILMNPLHAALPLGTLAANLIGGFIIGVVMGLAEPLHLSVTLRLLIVTGFLGGLTTFSSFSAETVGLLMKGDYLWGAVTIGAHVVGSLLLTTLGIWAARTLMLPA